MITKVVNCKKEKYDVYIGRPSRWGNPFRIGKDGSREDVIQKFKEYFYSNPKLMKDAVALKGKTLGCYCKPSPCHGDIIVDFLDGGGNDA